MAKGIDYLTGKAFRGDGDEKAEGALDDALAGYDGIQLPNLKDVDLESAPWLQDLKASTITGVDPLTAERAQAFNLTGTAFDGISTDPRLREQQMGALASLMGIAEAGGMTAQDEANLSRIQNQAATADRGRREAILQNANARGMGGGGMELLAQLDSSQAATDRHAQQGLDVAGMAQQRALDAMMQGGNMAGGIRSQDFGEQARVADAKDAIDRFNASNSTAMSQFNAGQGNNMAQFNAGTSLDTQKYNAGATQGADQFNISGRQGQSNTAADAKNASTMYNAGLPQQQFGNKVSLADGKAGVYGKQAGNYTNQADKNQEGWQNFLGGAAKAGATYAASDKRVKKDVRDVNEMDMDAFLATIAPKKFKYKDEAAHGEGDRTGVMAQDLLKSALGSEVVVEAEPGVLGYDKDKMQGVLLAAIKHLSDKIDKKGS